MKRRFWNQLGLMLFCAILGAVSGAVLWFFLKIVQSGTELLWDRLTKSMNSPIWYPIVICTIGGAAIGLFRKHFGDYPQTMKTVIGVVKKKEPIHTGEWLLF